MPTCIHCHTDQDASEFRPVGSSRGGRRRICNFCLAETPVGSKICSKCAETKPVEDFYPHTKQPDGKQPSCKKCFYRQKLASEAAHPGSIRRRRRGYFVSRTYGLSREDYKALVDEAGGRCMACGQPETITAKDGSPWPLCVDHAHETLQVRGLLCHACNRAAGAIGDDPNRLRLIADYLERFAVT